MIPWRRNRAVITLAGLLFSLAAKEALAQETTVSLSGVVRDATGGSLADGRVTITDSGRGLVRETRTDRSGFYRFLALPPGSYHLAASLPSFAPQSRIVELGVGQDASADFVLELGGLTSSTEIVAAAAPASPALGARVDGTSIRTMPLDGRDLARLVLLQPGVTWTRSSVQSNATGRGTRFSAGGAGPNQNAFVLDGTLINDALGHTPGSAQGLLLGVDSVEEFRVLTGVVGAEHGRAAGGVFLAITRSGTNAWRGSAFEFFRNDALDSPTHFDREKPSFTRNQVGASIGGPLRLDRTFVFATYEGLRQNKGVTQTALVPDLEARRGVVDGANVGLDPRAVPLLNLFPLPNGRSLGGGAAEYVNVLDQQSQADLATARIDHRFSGLDSAFVRYTFEDSHELVPRAFKELPNVARNRKHVLTGEARKGLPGGGLGSLRVGWSKSRPQNDALPLETTEQIVAGQPFGEINVPGLSDFGTDRAAPSRFALSDVSTALSLTQPRGAHLLKAGLSAQRLRLDGLWESRTRGQLRFRSISDFVRFRVQDVQAASADSDFARRYSQWALGAFIQDEWRVSSTLRLDLGLRWERATGPIEQDGKSSNLRDPKDPQVTVGDPCSARPPTTLLRASERSGMSPTTGPRSCAAGPGCSTISLCFRSGGPPLFGASRSRTEAASAAPRSRASRWLRTDSRPESAAWIPSTTTSTGLSSSSGRPRSGAPSEEASRRPSLTPAPPATVF